MKLLSFSNPWHIAICSAVLIIGGLSAAIGYDQFRTSKNEMPPRKITVAATRKVSSSSRKVGVLPADLKDLRLGMSLHDFKSIHPDLQYNVFSDIRVTCEINHLSPDIEKVTAYFDMKENPRLYELIVEFATMSARDREESTMGSYTKREENWIVPIDENSHVRIWTFEQVLVYKIIGPGPEDECGGSFGPDQLLENRALRVIK